MNFDLDPQQEQLQDSLARLLQAELPLARLQSVLAAGEWPATALHAAMSEMGWYGLLVAPEHGGAGLGWLDAALVAETLGRATAPLPFIASACIAGWALSRFGSAAQRERWLPGIASGAVIAGAALSEQAGGTPGDVQGIESRAGALHGQASFVLDGAGAHVFLVADREGSLHLVDAAEPGVAFEPLRTIDATRSVGTLSLMACSAEPLPGADADTAATLVAGGRLLLAADILGAGTAMLEAATGYAQVRTQFGQPIGAFQAVKHLCADMAAQLVPCRAYVWGTAHAFDRDPAGGAAACALLKAHLAEVGHFVARSATEVHGGMGFTELLGLHLGFKRIALSRQLLGGPSRLRAEAADALLGRIQPEPA